MQNVGQTAVFANTVCIWLSVLAVDWIYYAFG